MDRQLISDLLMYGPGLVFAVIVMVYYQQLVVKIMDVVKANTEAMAQVKDAVQASCEALTTHETHTVPARNEVAVIGATTERIEIKVDKILEQTRPRVGGQRE